MICLLCKRYLFVMFKLEFLMRQFGLFCSKLFMSFFKLSRVYICALLVFISLTPNYAIAQEEDFVWRLGSNFGINFNSSHADTFSANVQSPILETNSSVCDSVGELQFYTNGIAVFNSESDTMVNGDSLNPTFFTISHNPLPICQADIIIKRPAYTKEYYLFHETLIDDWNLIANTLYLTKIDMTLDSGKGAVTEKNIHIYTNDTLVPGYISAVKHGNGLDWWLITRKLNPCVFYTWLIQEDSILGPYSQSIVGAGFPFPPGAGQVCFSLDGETYSAMYSNKHLFVYDFNRCTGQLTYKFTSFLNDSSYAGTGCAFSSSGQFLYVSTAYIVYQFDLYATNIDSSKQIVAVFDGFASPDPPNYTRFNQMRLAPDSKIYISTDNGCDAMHVIEFPDSQGLACNVMQHSFYFSAYYANVVSVPNIPNFKLGAIGETGCDSSLSINETIAQGLDLVFYPNPVTDKLYCQTFSNSSSSTNVKMYDPQGRLIRVFEDIQSNKKSVLNVESLENGIYILKVEAGNSSKSSTIILAR
jgi:hypothetical protein